MPKRSIPVLIILSLLFPFIYHVYWLYQTKHEMTDRGADIPTTWLALIPFVRWYWFWKWSVGVEHVTRGRMTAPMAFVLMFFLEWFIIGPAIVQATLNEVPDEGVVNLPQARIA